MMKHQLLIQTSGAASTRRGREEFAISIFFCHLDTAQKRPIIQDTTQIISKSMLFGALITKKHLLMPKKRIIAQANSFTCPIVYQCQNVIIISIVILLRSKMPFTFHVEIRQSQVQGKGVFALEDIPKDAVIWVYECQNPLPIIGHQFLPNRVFNCEELQALSHQEIHLIFHSGVYLPTCDLLVNYRDGTQFTNHSQYPNSQTVFPTTNDHRELKIVSTKPIKKGEEICEDYFNLTRQTGWLTALMEKHNPDRLAFESYVRQELAKRQKLQTKHQ